MVHIPSKRLGLSRYTTAAVFAFVAFVTSPASAGFARQKWPAIQENELEASWLEGAVNAGFNNLVWPFKFPFGDFVISDCKDVFPNTAASSWLRLAYHDMATHNVNGDGLDGLDQSIRFELDRPENVGFTLKTTIDDLATLRTPYLSFADAIALGAVQTALHCGDIIVPFRGGRIDATAAGPPGVPEPHGTLEAHTESFRKQGFNQTEMIELVACGHSVGNVNSQDFPEIVLPVPGHPEFEPGPFGPFDTTGGLDPVIVHQYLNGTTKNPLVVNANQTFTSDLRIFSSDGNKTMKALADPAVFATGCRDLFERMINTVPRGVELGPVVEPIEVKVGRSFLTFDETLKILTEIRFLSENPSRNVTLKWSSRAGDAVHAASPSYITSTFTPKQATILGHSKIVHYWFNTTIDAATSISKFWFEVTEGPGETVKVVDNEGSGYPIEQDKVVYAPAHGWQQDVFQDVPVERRGWSLVMAIRTDAGPVTNVTAYNLNLYGTESNLHNHNFPSSYELVRDDEAPVRDGYALYKFWVPMKRSGAPDRLFFDVSANIGGELFKEEYVYSFYTNPGRGDIGVPVGTFPIGE